MKTQLILWSMFVIPWLTLFFMKKEHIRRFMPVALFAALTSTIMHFVGVSLKWWETTVTAFPLQFNPYEIGLFPVITMWIFVFTYRKFRLFLIVEAVLNVGFDFMFLGFTLSKLGVQHYVNLSPFVAFIITTSHSLLLYLYQIWQEKIFITPYRHGDGK